MRQELCRYTIRMCRCNYTVCIDCLCHGNCRRFIKSSSVSLWENYKTRNERKWEGIDCERMRGGRKTIKRNDGVKKKKWRRKENNNKCPLECWLRDVFYIPKYIITKTWEKESDILSGTPSFSTQTLGFTPPLPPPAPSGHEIRKVRSCVL